MSDLESERPSGCTFDLDRLVLKIDELIPSDVNAISPLVDRILFLIRESGCAPGQEYAVETALREALANAVIHGNRSDPRKRARVCCGCTEDHNIVIIVKDEGAGFDPAAVPSPLTAEQLNAEHGRGIYLINLVMDEVRFERGGTEIHMRKTAPPAAKSPRNDPAR